MKQNNTIKQTMANTTIQQNRNTETYITNLHLRPSGVLVLGSGLTTGVVTPYLFLTIVIISHLILYLRLGRLTRGVVVRVGSSVVGTCTSIGTLGCTSHLLGTIGAGRGGGTARRTARTRYGLGTAFELGGDVGNTRDGVRIGV